MLGVDASEDVGGRRVRCTWRLLKEREKNNQQVE